MIAHSPTASLTPALIELLGADRVLSDPAERLAYGYDNSRLQALPALVVFPEDHAQVQAVVRLCAEHRVPLIARGRGTGTTGATVPLDDAIVLSSERMTRILEMNPADRLIVVQPGVTNLAVQQAAAEHGFFWPPDPTSAAVCTIGGNLAYNSAGPRAVKYGTPRENTLALRAVTGAGDEVRTGTRTTKGVVGYDLTRLLIGSEGTLAIITEATLKLTPLAESRRTLRAIYADMHSAAQAVSRIMAQPVVPCALEFIDGRAIDMIRQHSDVEFPAGAGALLMIEIDGPEAAMTAAIQAIEKAAAGDGTGAGAAAESETGLATGSKTKSAKNNGLLDLRVAQSQAEVQALWATRKALSPALRNVAPKKINEDVVVPVSQIPALIASLEQLGERHGITIVNFGHAGNGNIHVNLLVNPDDAAQMAQADACLDGVFAKVLELGGTLSGEHGIGLVKRDFIAREIDPASLLLMQQIRQIFDPHSILNPTKTLPSVDTPKPLSRP